MVHLTTWPRLLASDFFVTAVSRFADPGNGGLGIAAAVLMEITINPGPSEEVGQTARSIIDALKSEPLSLALVVMNVLLLALFFYVVQTATSTRHLEMERVFAAQEKTNQLLFQCVPAERR